MTLRALLEAHGLNPERMLNTEVGTSEVPRGFAVSAFISAQQHEPAALEITIIARADMSAVRQ